MSFNATNISGLNSSTSFQNAQGYQPARGLGLANETANSLGYGIGRAMRGAFDSFWDTWQRISTSEPSAEEITQQRKYMVYQGGLRECVKRLEPALANLQMNPNDRGALKKVEQLSTHFARYLKPSREENLRELQSKILEPLEERASGVANVHIKNALSKCMPVFFQGNNSITEKIQTERRLAYKRQSQVEQDLTESKARHSSKESEGFLVSLTNSERINQSYGTNHLIDGLRDIFSSLDVGLSRLFSIFPGVSAELVQSAAVLERNDQHSGIAQADMAFVAYTTCYDALSSNLDSVIAIDTSSNKVIARIRVGAHPFAIAINPNSSYVYVVNFGGDILNIIEAYSNTLLTKVPLGFMPTGIAITPDGLYAYLIDMFGPAIGIMEISSKKVKLTATNDTISGIAMTPNGLYAYVTYPHDKGVGVIETTNNTFLKTIDLGNTPSGIAITPNGSYAYVAIAKTISVINTTSNKIVDTVHLPDYADSIAITPNGLYAYVTFPSRVGVIDMINKNVSKIIDVDEYTSGIAITPDGLYVYVINDNEGHKDNNQTICVINTTDNEITTKIKLNLTGCKNIAITPTKIPIPTRKENTGLIIGLTSAGGVALIALLGASGYLTYRWLKKEENPSELNSLINPLSTQQKMDLM